MRTVTEAETFTFKLLARGVTHLGVSDLEEDRLRTEAQEAIQETYKQIFKQCALSKYAPPKILSKLFNDCMISSECLNVVKTEGECSNHPYLSLEPQWECHLVCIPKDQCTSMYLT